MDPHGGALFDVTGNLIGPATLNGNAVVKPGVPTVAMGGDQLIVDGSGDSATTTAQWPLNFTGGTAWTVSVWFYNVNFSNYATIFAITNGPGGRIILTQIDGGNDWFIQVDTGGGGTGGSNNQPFPLGQWNHMAMVRNGTSLLGYVNGVQRNTYTLGSGAGATGGILELGSSQAKGGGSDFNGQYGPVCAWNRAFGANEIWMLYEPRTRWDLYWQPNTRAYSFMSAAAAAAGYLLVKN
jgi:hypothetical protein